MTQRDPYATNIFGGHRRQRAPEYPQVPAEPGLVVEVFGDDYVGAILNCERTYDGDFVRLEDRNGRSRLFRLRAGGFLLEGERITLTRYVPQSLKPAQPKYSNSGSTRVAQTPAQVAKASRIWVEGVHDAALVERIWGHDLRVEGIVVEQIEGLDNLPTRLEIFGPGPRRRLGVLADHLIENSKETRITKNVGPHVLVTGHPFVDIWQAVKPQAVGIRAWPEVPRHEDWKTGVCTRLGWANPQEGWHRVYNSVHSFRDVDPVLIGAVERLIDFVTNFELSKEDF